MNLFVFFSLAGKGYDSPFSCVCLHGDRKPEERKSNLEKFKSTKVKFVVCTDVAARGLDIKGIVHTNKIIIQLFHSALKLEKDCNFKSTKKNIFCTRKMFKTTKNPLLFFFSVKKLHFW